MNQGQKNKARKSKDDQGTLDERLRDRNGIPAIAGCNV